MTDLRTSELARCSPKQVRPLCLPVQLNGRHGPGDRFSKRLVRHDLADCGQAKRHKRNNAVPNLQVVFAMVRVLVMSPTDAIYAKITD
jgi:hypothetical protein